MKNNIILISVAVVIIGVAVLLLGRTNIETSHGTSQNTNQIQTDSTSDNISGGIFPDFAITDIDNKEFTKDSFTEKPTVMWFTTSWCVPCQIGAKKVAKLDDELGGDAFDVLVVFVDPRENENDLRKWKQNFANKDWIIAFDNSSDLLSEKINLKYLDTKYLLNEKGVIQNIDLQIANENYLEIIREAVENL